MSGRARLLAATEELLREAGMAGTGIKDVVTRSGTPIGSLYHHFPGGKAQLVEEALQIHAERSCELFRTFFDGKRTAAAALRALFHTAAEVFERRGADKSCAIGAVTLDLTGADAAIREICATAFTNWIALIEPHMPWADRGTRRSFAATVVASLEGAFIVGRATQSGQPFRDVGETLVAMVSPNAPNQPQRSMRKFKFRRRK